MPGTGVLNFGPPKTGWPDFSEHKPARWTYLSGPMRGIWGCNFAAFDQAQKVLESDGWGVYSPADHDRGMGFDFSRCATCSNEEIKALGFKLEGAILWDLDVIITKVWAVHFLPGWQNSSGANLEREAALFANRQLWYPTSEFELGGYPDWRLA